MAKNIAEIPFVEGTERLGQLARLTSDNDGSRVRGAYNESYMFMVPPEEDWQFLMVRSSLTTDKELRIGTINLNTGDTIVTFSSDVSIDASTTGSRLFLNGNAFVYDFTFTDSTGGTINPPLTGTQNISNGSYVLYRDKYPLPATFDRFPKNGGLIFYSGGRQKLIPEQHRIAYTDESSPSPTSNPEFCRLVERDSNGCQLVEIKPPPRDEMAIGMDFLRRLKPLKAETTGTCDVSSNGTVVTGIPGTHFTVAQTGWFFRIDEFGTGADSEWHKVQSIANDSSLTLTTAFGVTGATSANYTLSDSPEMPPKLHKTIMEGGLMQLLQDQNDPLFQQAQLQFTKGIADARKLYKTRIYDQEIDTIATEWQYRR